MRIGETLGKTSNFSFVSGDLEVLACWAVYSACGRCRNAWAIERAVDYVGIPLDVFYEVMRDIVGILSRKSPAQRDDVFEGKDKGFVQLFNKKLEIAKTAK